MARSQPEEAPYSALVGAEGNEKLVIAASENWVRDKSATIVCEEGYVDLEEIR